MNTINEPVSTVKVCVRANMSKNALGIYVGQRDFRIVALFDHNKCTLSGCSVN